MKTNSQKADRCKHYSIFKIRYSIFDIHREYRISNNGCRMMKCVSLTLSCLMLFVGSTQSQVTERSSAGSLSKPALRVATRFSDANGNSVLESEEEGLLAVSITNVGAGPAFDVGVKVTADDASVGLSDASVINTIPAGEQREAIVKLVAGDLISGKRVYVRVRVEESSLNSSADTSLSFATQVVGGPRLVFDNVRVNGNRFGAGQTVSPVPAGEESYIQLNVVNRGQRIARKLKARLVADTLITMSSINEVNSDSLSVGGLLPLAFWFTVNPNVVADSLSLRFTVDEERPKYAEQLRLRLPVKKREVGTPETRAADAFQQRNYDEALRLYEQALRAKPGSARLLYQYGLAFAAKGEMGSAREKIQRAAELGDPRAAAWLGEKTKQVVRVTYKPLAPNPFADYTRKIGVLVTGSESGAIYNALNTSKRFLPLLKGALKTMGIPDADIRQDAPQRDLKKFKVDFVLISSTDAARGTASMQLIDSESWRVVMNASFRNSDNSTALDDLVRIFLENRVAQYQVEYGMK
jgi:tetratricopeptide (TPR) repeat protein